MHYTYVYMYNTSPAQFTTYQRVLASYYDPQQSSVIKRDTAHQVLDAYTYNTIYHMCAAASTAFIHT